MQKITSLLTLACLLMLCSSAFAQGVSHGSAIVPGVYSYYNSATSNRGSSLLLSNITEGSIQCTIKYYDNDGNEIGSRADIYNGSQSAGVGVLVAGQTNTFSIPANATRLVNFFATTPQNLFGYAVVEWASTNAKTTKALVGVHHIYGQTGAPQYRATVTINNGQPF